jgi:hypothetical protein
MALELELKTLAIPSAVTQLQAEGWNAFTPHLWKHFKVVIAILGLDAFSERLRSPIKQRAQR